MNWRKRIPEWVAVLRFEHGAGVKIPWRHQFVALLSGPVPRDVWRDRLRNGCFKCVLFDKERMVCRGVVKPFNQWGCGCYLPFVALAAEPYKGGCYGRATFGYDFGWPAYHFRSRWSKMTAFWRFLRHR
jgi:hypothetical protein